MSGFVKVILLTLSLLLITNCANTKKEEIAEDYNAEELFDYGSRHLEAKNYKKAKSYFIKITQEYPYSKEANKAQYLEALANYKVKDYDSAILAVDEYIELYPGGEDIENAYYLKAICYYDQIVEVRLDQSIADKGLEALRSLLARFPQGEYAQDANLKIDLINDQLAGKEMTIARFYLKKGVVIGAINRFKNIVEHYHTTVYVEEALYRLVECYLTLGIKDQAVKYSAILGSNYPASSWYKKSYELLNNVK